MLGRYTVRLERTYRHIGVSRGDEPGHRPRYCVVHSTIAPIRHVDNLFRLSDRGHCSSLFGIGEHVATARHSGGNKYSGGLATQLHWPGGEKRP